MEKKPNDPAPVDLNVRDSLLILRHRFIAKLVDLLEGEETPSAPELAVIRAVLKDNHMNLPPEDEEARIAALKQLRQALPSFRDDDDDEGEENDG